VYPPGLSTGNERTPEFGGAETGGGYNASQDRNAQKTPREDALVATIVSGGGKGRKGHPKVPQRPKLVKESLGGEEKEKRGGRPLGERSKVTRKGMKKG